MIVEPWMEFSSFPKKWQKKMYLKMFSMNDRQSLMPSLWCFSKVDLNPTTFIKDDQHIAFTIENINKNFGFSVIMLPLTTSLEEICGAS